MDSRNQQTVFLLVSLKIWLLITTIKIKFVKKELHETHIKFNFFHGPLVFTRTALVLYWKYYTLGKKNMIHPIYWGRFGAVQRYNRLSGIPILTIKHIGHVISSSSQLLCINAAYRLWSKLAIYGVSTQSIWRRNNEIDCLHDIKSKVMLRKGTKGVITAWLLMTHSSVRFHSVFSFWKHLHLYSMYRISRKGSYIFLMFPYIM